MYHQKTSSALVVDSILGGSFHLQNLWQLKAPNAQKEVIATAPHPTCPAGQRTKPAGLGSLSLLSNDHIQVPAQKANDNHTDLCFVSFQAKTIDSSKIDAVDRESPVSLTDSPLANKFNSTVSPLKTKQAQLPANEGEHFSECVSKNIRKDSVGSISRLLSYFQWWKSTWGFLKNFHVYHWVLSPSMLRSFPWQAVQRYMLNLEP